MSTEKEQRWLGDIIKHIDRINGYVAPVSLDQLINDQMRLDAVERCFQIITEVAHRLKGRADEWMPQQEWQQIRNLGNRLRHRYDSVEADFLWEIIQNEFPSLRLDCERTIERLRTGELEGEIGANTAQSGSFLTDVGSALEQHIEGLSADSPSPEQNDQQQAVQARQPKPKTGR